MWPKKLLLVSALCVFFLGVVPVIAYLVNGSGMVGVLYLYLSSNNAQRKK